MGCEAQCKHTVVAETANQPRRENTATFTTTTNKGKEFLCNVVGK